MWRPRAIRACESGNVAIMFGLALVPVLGMFGGAVDFSHRTAVRVQLQSAIDTAVVAAARFVQEAQQDEKQKWGETRKAAEQKAKDVFNVALGGDLEAAAVPRIKVTKEKVALSAEVSVPTTFLSLLGIDSLGAAGSAEVVVPQPLEVEIVFVLDYSGSMKENDKYLRMTAAAQAFIAKVAAERRATTMIGVVPFSKYVYASVPGRNLREVPSNAKAATPVCLLNRDYPHSVSDEQPLPNLPGSRWPSVNAADPACKPYGPLLLRDLTDDFSGLSAALSAMRPTGLTNIALATEMGWHVLSSGEPFETARNDKKADLRKVMVLLTDGMQTVDAMGPSGDISTLAADEATDETCRNMMEADIQLFTIAYDIEEQRVRDLLVGCASEPRNFYEAKEASDIAAVFEDIYDQLAESVWISR